MLFTAFGFNLAIHNKKMHPTEDGKRFSHGYKNNFKQIEL